MRLLRPLHYARDERAIKRQKRKERIAYALMGLGFVLAVVFLWIAFTV